MGRFARSERRFRMAQRATQARMAVVVVLALWAAAVLIAAKTWNSPHTPDGQPDLQGIWSNATITPLERPRDLAGKEFFTEQEAADYEKQVNAGRAKIPDLAADNIVDQRVWWERGTKVVQTLRTSLVVDPPDGRIPALTPEAQKRMQESRAYTRVHGADSAQDRSIQERCLS